VRDGWNLTGDAYLMDAEGYFFYQSRTDDMIISSGYNIASPEVEEALMQHPSVAECAVIGEPDEERGQIVKAFVTLRPGLVGDVAMVKTLQDTLAQSNSPTNCHAPRPANCSVSSCDNSKRALPQLSFTFVRTPCLKTLPASGQTP
jgi:acyl-coenzyme A synthetase/AMP-(fatty) acid ligase